jgi:leucyl-tRNA---protein transferase
VVGGVAITKDIEAMFYRHAERFSENKPDSLYSYFADDKASMPCKALQCSVYQDAQLLAVSFFDVGATALSSVYAMFEPDAHLYSLGTYTMLCELDFARRTGKQYLYSGYAHEAASHLHSLYGYKKHFSPSEAYAWLDDWSLLQ